MASFTISYSTFVNCTTCSCIYIAATLILAYSRLMLVIDIAAHSAQSVRLQDKLLDIKVIGFSFDWEEFYRWEHVSRQMRNDTLYLFTLLPIWCCGRMESFEMLQFQKNKLHWIFVSFDVFYLLYFYIGLVETFLLVWW